MQIYIIRHGDPDYPNNTLTEKGFEEVQALSEMYSPDFFDVVYSSPLGRSVKTAEAVIQGKKPIHLVDEFVEFHHSIEVEGKRVTNWDFLPEYLDSHSDIISDRCLDSETMRSGNIKEEYEKVIQKFDEILEENGYKREGTYYKVTDSNKKKIAIFCHLGLMSVLVSRLANLPYIFHVQYFACAPSGVTIFTTEERRKGIAQFRCATYGDISHLRKKGLEPSFACRFCENFDDDTRH